MLNTIILSHLWEAGGFAALLAVGATVFLLFPNITPGTIAAIDRLMNKPPRRVYRKGSRRDFHVPPSAPPA